MEAARVMLPLLKLVSVYGAMLRVCKFRSYYRYSDNSIQLHAVPGTSVTGTKFSTKFRIKHATVVYTKFRILSRT